MRVHKRIGVIAGSIAMLLLAGCGTVQPVELAAATVQGNMSPAVQAGVHSFSGKVVGVEEVEIYSIASGRIAAVYHDMGDEIEANTPLFAVEQEELAASLQMAKADLALATAKWAEAKKGTRKEELLYAEAGWQQAVSKYQDVKNGKRPEELRQLQAATQAAKTAYEVAVAKEQRTQALFSQGAVTKQSLEDAQSGLTQAMSAYKRSEEELTLARVGATKPALEALQANVEQMRALYEKAKNGVTPEQLAQYEAAVQKAQAAVDHAEYQLKNATIASPIKGVVGAKSIHTGEMVNPSQPAMTVVNTEQVYVVISVTEDDIARFTMNQQVAVTVEAIDEQVQGKVTRISPKADAGTNAFTVKIRIDNPKGTLRSGMTGVVQL